MSLSTNTVVLNSLLNLYCHSTYFFEVQQAISSTVGEEQPQTIEQVVASASEMIYQSFMSYLSDVGSCVVHTVTCDMNLLSNTPLNSSQDTAALFLTVLQRDEKDDASQIASGVLNFCLCKVDSTYNLSVRVS